ncbi:hypothetical protein GCM10010517_25400 [Streptosporangium fragile]|uniref:Uncharacterized protein n=1 Tax=Streptosporangium fragile TaxID=46186 RepID=A0ABP6IEJ5_9ACTN
MPCQTCDAAVAGRLSAHHDHWRVGNQGRVRLIVENIEHPDEYFGVTPGRTEVPVPFESARVVGACETEAEITVLGPAPWQAGPAGRVPAHDSPDKLDARPNTGQVTGRGWKREVLVTRALRLGLVDSGSGRAGHRR